MSTHPEILWAQRSSETDEGMNIVYLTVNLTEINESTLEVSIEPKKVTFNAKAGRPEEREYKFDLDLYDEVVPEKSIKRLNTRSYSIVLHKKEHKQEFWPRLTVKKLPFVKTDFSKWVDEDEQDGEAVKLDDEEGMGGMGGMGGMEGMGGMGMPGMPGMGGMGGLGGMGAGGMDLEKMMADFKANEGGSGPEGVDPADSDSDDDGPPPLEDAEPSASSSS